MLQFVKDNVNPKNRKTGDCTTRAIAACLHISYEDALKLQCEQAIKHCYGIMCNETLDYVMKLFGYVKQKQPRKEDNTKYTVGELDKVLFGSEKRDGEKNERKRAQPRCQ